MEITGKAKRQCSGIALGAVLVMSLVLAQTGLNPASAVGVEELPGYDNCFFARQQPEDPISMNTVRSGNIVKTIHAEKEVFFCLLDQGGLPVIVDVTTYIEIYENIVERKVIETNAIATTCLKDRLSGGEDDDTDFDGSSTATLIDCESYEIPSTPVPVGSDCEENARVTHPQEMNTVNKGKLVKTIEAQKEVFLCLLGGDSICIIMQVCANTIKKVDVILFTEIYEDLETQEVEVQFHSMRCVVFGSDDLDVIDVDDERDDRRDATVETCQFSTIEN